MKTMNKKLEKIKYEFINQMKDKDSVLGAWNFGSETHNLSDDYSDVDIVLLIDKEQFGQITFFLEECLEGICDDISYFEKTYWYHAYMTGKYLKREDYFKLNHVLHTMYETHMSMLLVGFDRITWGGSANKLHFIPIEKQAHLKKYYCPENLDGIEQNLISCMKWFQEDTQEICKLKGLDYSAYLGDIISLNRDLREVRL